MDRRIGNFRNLCRSPAPLARPPPIAGGAAGTGRAAPAGGGGAAGQAAGAARPGAVGGRGEGTGGTPSRCALWRWNRQIKCAPAPSLVSNPGESCIALRCLTRLQVQTQLSPVSVEFGSRPARQAVGQCRTAPALTPPPRRSTSPTSGPPPSPWRTSR